MKYLPARRSCPHSSCSKPSGGARTTADFFRASLAILLLALLPAARAATLLDDTFADGTRNNQNLPTDSAWYVSSAGAVSTATGAMTWSLAGSAVLGVTYFGTNSSSPVQLQVGDTLAATIKFTLNNVDTTNSSQGFRIGLFDFADSTLTPRWAIADLTSSSGQGTNVQGYALFQNMDTVFNNASPMTLVKRTNVGDGALLSASGDWTSLTSGPGNTNVFSGFANGGQYTLQLALQRADAVTLIATVTWQNLANGASLSTSVTDSAAGTFNFDGIAMRPSNAAQTATNIVLNEVRVDLIAAGTPASVTSEPQGESVYTNQPASFTVGASGAAPLSYQWYFNTNTPIPYGTNATLTLTNAQLSDAGMYSVIVSNNFGSDTSAPVSLIVSIPTAPSIVTQPQSQTVLPGQDTTFIVEAGGAAPLSYQWYFNTNTPIVNASGPTLTLTNISAGQAGTYSVTIGNFVGSIDSANALLTVNTNPVAPSFTTEPSSQIILAGGVATFTATVAGSAPISYQWYVNGTPIAGQTSPTLTLAGVQSSDEGSYTLVASNSVNTATSTAAVLTVTPNIPVPSSAYDLTGFAYGATGGGVLPETSANYAHVYTATDLANALNSKTVQVIEIMNDLNLGYNEIEATAKAGSEPFRTAAPPLMHPVLLQTGVSLVDIEKKNGLTIFSANGSTIRHAKLNIKSCGNVVVRNLKFDQLWEWDELTKGDYDQNDWDFITLGDGGAVSNIWVDHCTFTKSYDGILDTKAGCSKITISWCRYMGDDGATNTNSWVWQQINALEATLATGTNKMYTFLRTNGFSPTDLVTILQGHDKTHLAGQNDLDPNNATISMTFHHLWLSGVWDRCVPRLRGGNVHDYNLYVDDTLTLAAKRMREARAAAMSPANQNILNNTYDFDPPINGTIATENGAILVEKSVYIDSLWPLRNNQTDPSNPAYTGKIQALDSVYQFDGTVTRGNSTDPGNPMGPFQAPIIPFSWNTNSGAPNGQLPYSYSMDDPSQLQAILTSPATGAGAGVLTWPKTNWLMTVYAPTAPVISASPQNQVLSANDNATFTVVAGGSAPLSYYWFFNTNNLIASATNATLSLAGVQATNAGTYFVVISNSVGSVTSAVATLTVNGPTTGFSSWQALNFSSQQHANPAISGPGASPAGDGIANLMKYALGLPPLAPANSSTLTSILFTNGSWELLYHRPASINDVIYDPQTSLDLFNWSDAGVVQQMLGLDTNGLQIWGATYSGAAVNGGFYRLVIHQ